MIKSSEIQAVVAAGESVDDMRPAADELEMGRLRLPISDSVIELSVAHTHQVEQIIRESLAVYPREATLVQDVIGQPTSIARVDCTIGPSGIRPYECEDRPAGLGVEHLLRTRVLGRGNIDSVQEHISRTLGAEMVVIRHPEAMPNDDGAALDVRESVDGLNGHLVLVRGEPHMFADETMYRRLAGRSVSTIRTEGDKNYVHELPVFGGRQINSPDHLPGRDESFVLKTPQGSKSQGVAVYLSKADQKTYGDKGIVTHTKARRMAEALSNLIVEPLKPPIRVTGIGNMALRVVALVGQDRIEVTGGLYTIRPEMLVHGASNSVAGLVVLEGSPK